MNMSSRSLKIGKAFSTSLHLWFCIRIPITIVIGLPNLIQNIGDPTVVLVMQINNMIALFTILFVLVVLDKFFQTPQVLCDYRWNDCDMYIKEV